MSVYAEKVLLCDSGDFRRKNFSFGRGVVVNEADRQGLSVKRNRSRGLDIHSWKVEAERETKAKPDGNGVGMGQLRSLTTHS
jgi:hypothetical protein